MTRRAVAATETVTGKLEWEGVASEKLGLLEAGEYGEPRRGLWAAAAIVERRKADWCVGKISMWPGITPDSRRRNVTSTTLKLG